MRDSYYDERLGNRNWDAIRRKYIDMAAESPDLSTFTIVVDLMLGELNGSHLGFTPCAASYPPRPVAPARSAVAAAAVPRRQLPMHPAAGTR